MGRFPCRNEVCPLVLDPLGLQDLPPEPFPSAALATMTSLPYHSVGPLCPPIIVCSSEILAAFCVQTCFVGSAQGFFTHLIGGQPLNMGKFGIKT